MSQQKSTAEDVIKQRQINPERMVFQSYGGDEVGVTCGLCKYGTSPGHTEHKASDRQRYPEDGSIREFELIWTVVKPPNPNIKPTPPKCQECKDTGLVEGPRDNYGQNGIVSPCKECPEGKKFTWDDQANYWRRISQ